MSLTWAQCGCAADAVGPGLAASATVNDDGVVEPDGAVSVTEPVSLPLAKKHCRVDTATDDDLVALYLSAARQQIENYCERLFVLQGFIGRYHVVSAGLPIALGRWPVQAVSQVERLPADGSAAVPITGAVLDPAKGVLNPPPEGWPVGPDNVRVHFTAGPPTSSTPADVTWCVLGLTAQHYDNRATVTLGGSAVPLPFGYEEKLAPYRMSTGVVTEFAE